MLKERHKRLDVLYRKHHQWLLAVARNTTSDEQHAEDLVGDLYVYLAEVKNPEKYLGESENVSRILSARNTQVEDVEFDF